MGAAVRRDEGEAKANGGVREMIEKILIISALVFAIHYTMKEGEIFGRLGTWFEMNLPVAIHPPIFDCAVCMAPWHGTYLYWLIWGFWLKTSSWQEWLVCVIAAMGLNAVINQLTPKDD